MVEIRRGGGRRGEGEGEGGRGEGEETDIKSNNPHLTGGEKGVTTDGLDLGVPKNRGGPPKWMVKIREKPYWN